MNVVASHWSANAAVLGVVAAVVAVHLCGLRGLAADARRGGDMPRGLYREVAAFYGGLTVVVLALLSPLAYWSAHYIWVRSVQDVLLANLAPAFLVLGAPWLVLHRGLSLRARTHGPGRSPGPWPEPEPGRAAWLARVSVLTVIAFNVAWCAWHVPALYDGALRYPAASAACGRPAFPAGGRRNGSPRRSMSHGAPSTRNTGATFASRTSCSDRTQMYLVDQYASGDRRARTTTSSPP